MMPTPCQQSPHTVAVVISETENEKKISLKRKPWCFFVQQLGVSEDRTVRDDELINSPADRHVDDEG